MGIGRLVLRASVASASCCAILSAAAHAATFLEFVDPHPALGNEFGAQIQPLSTGNVVISSPYDDAGATDAGAVYLFNGSTGALISTLRGSTANDNVGSVTVLTNGNFVVSSPNWNNGRGAVTWASGTTGVSGVISVANSLVGSVASDQVGGGGVTALTNGNYVVRSHLWNNGGAIDAGAVTWGNGTTGVTGVVSAANSLVGTTTNDLIGNFEVVALSNGNYVFRSTVWNNGAIVAAGAATWGNGATGTSGVISAANSLVGSTANDNLGSFGVTALANGSYVVRSPSWNNGAIVDAGAATWGSGTTGVSGSISAANSLVGTTASDFVGGGVTALSNGNYVVTSPGWNNGAVVDAGAATWASGTTGVNGAVSAANSLVGSKTNDLVGNGGATALSNGNYVVVSRLWGNVGASNAGAVTWGSGTTGISGVVSTANSLVGSTANDNVGLQGVITLSNGNYVVGSVSWNNGTIVDVGAATWGSGSSGVSGAITTANSLVGFNTSDGVGQVTALANGNYVVSSPGSDAGGAANTGAVTFGSGVTGITGIVTAANSLVGSFNDDFVGVVTALSNGNYVVVSQSWNKGAVTDAGAVTWGNGSTGIIGPVSAANSLVGSRTDDFVGINGVTALPNGNYVVHSSSWDNGGILDAGAATWGNGTTGLTGVVSAANSLVGFTDGDLVGLAGAVAFSNGDYVVPTASWDNGGVADAGAATWGSGAAGVIGVVSPANSVVGATANTTLQTIVPDNVNNTFFGRFLEVGGWRVRVGPVNNSPVTVSAVDIPSDQGGWLRLTFLRSPVDIVSSVPVETYGVWRHVPGTLAEGRKLEGLSDVTGLGPPRAELAASFPPGTWALITSVPAVQQPLYVVDVPTISNAAPNDFVVTAHTTTPSLWFISSPVSGQSVDNLAPAQPTLFIASYSGGQTNLQWATNTENDLGSYHLHRGASAGFTPSIANRIASQIATSYADVGPAGGYYKLSALDVNGNESGFALVTPGQTTGVDDEAPVAFALEGARPNPASRKRLDVAFALPTGASARLDLMDVSGRRVLSREVGSMGAGRHTLNLSAGRTVAAGLYWVRLTQGANQQRMRVAVIE